MQLLEIAGRVVAVYVACLILLRLSGRREMSELGPMDLLAMLLLSETVSPSLTGGDDSLLGGFVAATTLIVLCVFTERLSFHSKRANKLINGDAVVLIRNGTVDRNVLRRFMITDDDLHATLHAVGLLHVDQVERAFVEAGGVITLVKKSG